MKIVNGNVFQKNGDFIKGNICTDRDLISDFSEDDITIDAGGLYVIPGIIDIHFHGCMGMDFCDATPKALEIISAYELSHGVTSICPASMTYDAELLSGIFENAADYKTYSKVGASLVGINMEGPFLSFAKRGAQNPLYMSEPDVSLFRELQKRAGGLIKLVDIAPELPGAEAFINELSGEVHISLAHSASDYETACRAFELGADHVTHLYNAMSDFNHREPGIAGAAADNENVFVEIIADGIHIHEAVIRSTIKMFGADRIVFVSDSMRATGMPDGQYELGGQAVFVNGKKALLRDGTIAGSVSNLMDCVRTLHKKMNIPLGMAVKGATVNPARSIGLFDKVGSLETGKKADIVLLDEELNIKHVIHDGKIV